ncbi:hypothetical protein PCAR4_830071 [Paraburkholderia caribensis]|nr:hypothetical protein PCAR4_830071 [Paraburkholderia caribensis]
MRQCCRWCEGGSSRRLGGGAGMAAELDAQLPLRGVSKREDADGLDHRKVVVFNISKNLLVGHKY